MAGNGEVEVKCVELLTSKGDLLARVEIPESPQPPEIIIWYGSRYFQLREDGRYWEARAAIGKTVDIFGRRSVPSVSG